jgi:hypothetical protein
MDQVDCLERPNQYLELDNLAFVVPLDHVDAVNVDAINLNLKLQHCVPRTREALYLYSVADGRGRPASNDVGTSGGS